MSQFYSSQSALRRAYLRADIAREQRLEIAAWETYQKKQEEEAKKDNEWGIMGRIVGAIGGFFVGGFAGAKVGWQVGGTGADAARVLGAGPNQFDDIAYLRSQPFLQGGKFNRFSDHSMVEKEISAQKEIELAEKLDIGLSLVQSAMSIIGSVSQGSDKHLLTDKEGKSWSAEEWRKGKVVTDPVTGVESVEKLRFGEKIGLTVREAQKSELEKYMELYKNIFGKPFKSLTEEGSDIDFERSIGIDAPNSAFNKEFSERVRTSFEGLDNWNWTKFEAARHRSYALSQYDNVPKDLQTLNAPTLTNEQKVNAALVNFDTNVGIHFGPMFDLYDQNKLISPDAINDINDWANNGPNPNNPIGQKGIPPLMPTMPKFPHDKYGPWATDPSSRIIIGDPDDYVDHYGLDYEIQQTDKLLGLDVLDKVEPLGEFQGPPMSNYMKRREEGKFLWKDFFGKKDRTEADRTTSLDQPEMKIPKYGPGIPSGMAGDLDEQRRKRDAIESLDEIKRIEKLENLAKEARGSVTIETPDEFFDEEIVIKDTYLEDFKDWDTSETIPVQEIIEGKEIGDVDLGNWIKSLTPNNWKDINKILNWANMYGTENMDPINPPIGLGLDNPVFYQDILEKIKQGVLSKQAPIK